MENEEIRDNVRQAKHLYSTQNYDECIDLLQDCLSDAASQDKNLLAELHLLLAKCHRGRSDLKSAILSCESSIEARPQWKYPFLYRSAVFQALHSYFQDTDGDVPENIDKDRQEASVTVHNSQELVDALKSSQDGDRIFVEKGKYKAKSLFLCGKNVSLIGASVKDCILEFDNNTTNKLETFLICGSSGVSPTLIKRLTFKSVRVDGKLNAKIKFVGVAGGTVQLEDCLFDGTGFNDVDAIYTNAKIAGTLAANYPPPYVITRFCVFDSCQSYGAFSAFRARGSIRSCYFLGKKKNISKSELLQNLKISIDFQDADDLPL